MRRRLLSMFLVLAMLVGSLAGCGPAAGGKGDQTRIFIDSIGREVELPVAPERVAVSGPIANMALISFAPEKLVGTSGTTTKDMEEYLPEHITSLPVLGQLYGGTTDLNMEELLLANPQVIIDIGVAKVSTKADLDKISQQTGIPTVHIHYTTAEAGETFRMLGDLLGSKDRGETFASYCETVYADMKALAAKVDKVDLLYVTGVEGYGVIAQGSYQSEIIDLLSNNVAVVDNPSSQGTGNTVEMEQLLLWNPEVIVFSADGVFDKVAKDPNWSQLEAIKTGNYYEVPFGPYNWMGFPPSVQRYLGMLWIAELLYPADTDYDLQEEVQKYYKMFYHQELSDAQYQELVANSIGKRDLNQTTK